MKSVSSKQLSVGSSPLSVRASTAAGGTNFTYDDSGNMTADGTYTYAYDPENRLIQVTKSGGPTDLAAALDSFLTYTTGGAASWTPVGGAYAQSGYINHNQESWMQAQVEGPGTLTFQWKVSSEAGCDQLQFYLDDELQDAIDGEQDWDEISYQVTGSGTHTFRWRYQKDYSVSEGEDAGYVDQVQWTGPLPEDPPTDRWHHLTYVYDAAGRRIEKQYDYDTVLKYVYDGDHCLAEYDAGGNLRRKYIYGRAVDQPICMIEGTQTYAGTYYYHFDALGSVVALTDSDANTVNVYEYDVYGRVGILDANHPNRFMFTGREYDKETGLYYYRARYYNPQIGRFLQTDPVGYGVGMNLYGYCGNNPSNCRDPLGLYDDRDVSDFYSSELPGSSGAAIIRNTLRELGVPEEQIPSELEVRQRLEAEMQIPGATGNDLATWGSNDNAYSDVIPVGASPAQVATVLNGYILELLPALDIEYVVLDPGSWDVDTLSTYYDTKTGKFTLGPVIFWWVPLDEDLGNWCKPIPWDSQNQTNYWPWKAAMITHIRWEINTLGTYGPLYGLWHFWYLADNRFYSFGATVEHGGDPSWPVKVNGVSYVLDPIDNGGTQTLTHSPLLVPRKRTQKPSPE